MINDTLQDELQDAYEATFNRVTLAIIIVSLMLGLVAFLTEGVTSVWFIRAGTLLIGTVGAYALRLFKRVFIASYMLVFLLFGLLAEIFLHSSPLTGAAAYLFIPVIVVAGMLLSPVTVLVTLIGSIGFILAALLFSEQLTLYNLQTLQAFMPALIITVLIALLITQYNRHMVKLGQLLRKNREILRNRTRKSMETVTHIDEFQQQIIELQQQLTQARAETGQALLSVSQTDNQFYHLVQQSIRETKGRVKILEQELDRLGESPPLQNQTDYLEPMWQKIYGLKGFMVQLEAMLQVEWKTVELSYQPINLQHMLSEVAGVAQGLARQKPINVRYKVREDLPQLQADPVRLRQALLQLLTNAINYTDQGSVEIQAELARNGENIQIVVSDTGRGIRQNELSLIFERFRRGANSVAEIQEGAGLGLSLTRRLVELHGGQVWAASVLGVGSTFYLTLPLDPEPKGATASKARFHSSELLDQTLPNDIEYTILASNPLITKPRSTTRRTRSSSAATTSYDPDQTVVSNSPAPFFYQPSRLSDPVRRKLPLYIRRFAYILLGLLLMIGITVVTLAIVNGPVDQQASAGATKAALNPVSIITKPPISTINQLLIVEKTATLAAVTKVTVTTTAGDLFRFQPSAAPTSDGVPILDDVPPIDPTPVNELSGNNLSSPAPANSRAASRPTVALVPLSTPSPTNLPPTATSTVLPATIPTSATVDSPTFISRVTRSVLIGSSRLMISPDQDDPNLASDSQTIRLSRDSRLSWSPNGQLIFSGNQGIDRDIYQVDAESVEPVRLTVAAGDDLQPAWSPDGLQIAFSSGRAGNLDIYVMDADGANPVRLTHSQGFDEWPVWSPDGRQIAFVSDRDGNAEIYLMNADGSNLERLTNHPADDWPAAWSPDGLKLIFTSNRDDNWNLYLIHFSGGPLLRLTNDPGDERDPVWSPDGQTIAFAYTGGDNWDIFIMPAGAIREISRGTWTQITNTPGDERYPSWQPLLDGTRTP